MNFVIVSCCFLPDKGAESFCTTRFASALARAGHDVSVIALLLPGSDAKDAISCALIDPRVKVHYVPFACKHRPVLKQIRYQNDCWHVAAIPQLIDETRRVLAETKDPILVSRTHPIVSSIVGHECRRLARKWICHLSDPIPSPVFALPFSLKPRPFLTWLKLRWNRIWMDRFFRTADAVSVTCPGAIRFFGEHYPSFANVPSFVTTHIGDTRLSFLKAKPFPRDFEGKMVLHAGELYASRNMNALADAVLAMNRKGIACTLVHVGNDYRPESRLLEEFPERYVRYPNEPGLAVAAAKVADLLYTTDSITDLPYSPQILSKFVYQVWEDVPMLVETAKEGMMSQCCFDYPEAGLFWVDRHNLGTMPEALERALAFDRSRMDRSRIRKVFSEEEVARMFAEMCGDGFTRRRGGAEM